MKRFVMNVTEHCRMEEGRGNYLLNAEEGDIQAFADILFDSICGDYGARIPTVHRATSELYEFDDSKILFEQNEYLEYTEIMTYWAERQFRNEPVYVNWDDLKYVRSYDYNC